jgi:anti-sigma factor (TIGR02949 family)
MENSTQTTDCDKVVEILDLIVDGEASSDDQKYFFSHVEECATCFGHYNREKELKQFLKESLKQKTVPSHLVANIRELVFKLPETV